MDLVSCPKCIFSDLKQALISKGRTIRKVMGGGGKSKNKNRAGETEKK
jgi:hypothetical protein